VTIFATLLFSSCQKEEIATSPGNTINKAPLAKAGVDQTIMLPTNMVTIDGILGEKASIKIKFL